MFRGEKGRVLVDEVTGKEIDPALSHLMEKDAYKKCMNLFLDLAKTPIPDNEKKAGKKAPEVASVESLALFGTKEIDENEDDGDMDWFREYGRARAIQYFNKLKALR